MDAADTLYGVSMGGDGVSRVISRRLAGRPADAHALSEAAEAAEAEAAGVAGAARAWPILRGPMARTWHELFVTGEDAPPAPDPEEQEPQRRGFFRRLRENMSKTREALGAELQATVFQSLDGEAFEHLEETLIYADVGAPTTAAIVEKLEHEAETGELTGGEDLSRRLPELLAETARRRRRHHPPDGAPDRDPRGWRERQRQDDHDREDRVAPPEGARPQRAARGWRHLPRRRRRAAHDLGRAGRLRDRARRGRAPIRARSCSTRSRPRGRAATTW